MILAVAVCDMAVAAEAAPTKGIREYKRDKGIQKRYGNQIPAAVHNPAAIAP